MAHQLVKAGVIVALVCLPACGGSDAATERTDAAPGHRGGGDRGATDASPGACDDYVRLVTQCIDTKMPESERAEERRNIETFKKMLREYPTGGARMSAQCAANLRTAIRQDSYGCYGEEAAKRGIQTACSVLTRAELEAIVGARLEDGVAANMKCRYAFAEQPFRQPLQIAVRWHGGRDDVEAARDAQRIVNGGLTKEAGASDFVPGAKVDGVGDDAFFTIAGVWPMLNARLGDVSIGVEGAARDQMIAIARTALPRITPEADGQTGGR